MIRFNQINFSLCIKPNIAMLIFYIFALMIVGIFTQGNYKLQFMALNLILFHYLIYEFLNFYKKGEKLILIQPYFLVIVFFFILMHLMPNLRLFFVDPMEVLPARMIFWSDDSYKPLIKAMYLLNLSAVAIFLGYKNKSFQFIGEKIRLKFNAISTSSFRPLLNLSNLQIFLIIGLGIISTALQISWGIFGYGVSDEILAQYASYAQWFSYIDKAQLLLVIILAYFIYGHQSSKLSLKIIFFLLLTFLSAKGFFFASKGMAITPIFSALLGAYLATGKVLSRFILLSFVVLIFAFVIIEPYRALKNVYPDAGFLEAITLLQEVPAELERESVEDDITFLNRLGEIGIWFMGRNDNFSFSANAIEFKDRYGIPDNNNPDFLGSIIYAPVLAYVPRFIWKSKPRDQIGAWYEDSIMQSPNYSASAFGAIGYSYYAGGVVGVFLIFFFFGLMQRLVAEVFLKMNSLPGFCAYFALILPITFIFSEVGGVITGFLRSVPIIILGVYLLFYNYKNIFSSKVQTS